MSFINNIHINNFKSIKDVTIDGCKRINVFIGEPNVGKSNILEGLGLFSYLVETSNINTYSLKDVVRLSDVSDIYFNGNIDKGFEILLDNRKICATGYIDVASLFSLDFKYTSVKHNTMLHCKSIQFNSDFKMGLTTYTETDFEKENKSYFSIKKYDYQPTKIDSLLSSKMVQLTNPFGENLFRIVASNSKIKLDFINLLEKYQLLVSFENSGVKVIKKREDGTFFIFPFNQLADTLKRLIFYLAAIKSNKDSVLLFEEPEAHLFPPYISHITSEMIYDKSNQYFVATHSEYFLTDLLEDNDVRNDLAVFVVGYNGGETTINRLTDDQIHEVYNYGVDLFLNIKNYVA